MDEEDSNYETFKNVTTNLRKDLECPICLDVVKHPFKMCARGHLMCVDCLNHLTSCPTCKGDLLEDIPVCIKNLLEHLPHQCKNSANGCKKIVEEGNIHEKFCGFRLVVCRAPDCKQEVMAQTLLEHYKQLHQSLLITTTEIKDVTWSKFDPANNQISNNLVYLFKNLFWFRLDNSNEEKQLKVKLEAIAIDKFEGDFYVKTSFVDGDFEITSTVKAYIPEENETSEEEHEFRCGRMMNRFCMTVPHDMLSDFIKDETLYLNLNFFKR